jgi:hypothetical protein
MPIYPNSVCRIDFIRNIIQVGPNFKLTNTTLNNYDDRDKI